MKYINGVPQPKGSITGSVKEPWVITEVYPKSRVIVIVLVLAILAFFGYTYCVR